jgi:SPP1 family predicted phage head-tail adaptor
MNPGRMDRQVTLQRFTVTQSAIGEAIKTWATLATVPAAYKPSPGGEPVNGDKVEAELPVVFTIRFYSGLNPKDRLTYGGQVYNILAVTEVGRKHLMELKARRQE